MDFAGSSILCQFSSSDSATVLRWFCDSSSVQYIRSCIVLRWFYDSLSVQYVWFRKSVTVLNWFCDSSSVQYIRFRDPAFVLRWFYDSLSVQYIRSCFSILQVCFANSSILRRFHFRNCTSFPVFRQFFDSLPASWILLRVSLILQFFASSARWSCILCRYSFFKVPYFYFSVGLPFGSPLLTLKYSRSEV